MACLRTLLICLQAAGQLPLRSCSGEQELDSGAERLGTEPRTRTRFAGGPLGKRETTTSGKGETASCCS
jgi:hypothetical protein